MNAVQFQKKLLSIQQIMMNFALMLTTNENDARDLMQDTALKVLSNRKKYVENANFKGWVLTIMRNIFINNYHKVVRTQTMVSHLSNFKEDYILIEQSTPESVYQLHEINHFIDKLKDDLKIPFALYLTGYSYSEISEQLNIPLGTVKSRIFFARHELRRSLTRH